MNDSNNSNDSFDNDDSDGDTDSGAKKKNSEFAQLLEASLRKPQKRPSVGDKIKGEILVIGRDEVYVSTGTITDGMVSKKDLLNEKGEIEHKVGDVLELFVTQVRGTEIHLSPNPTSKNLADDLEDAFDMMLPVEGKVSEVCKGGFRVTMKGKLAFCPISQMDIKRIETPEEYVGKRFEFRITQFSEGGRNIVVSRRKILEEERELSEGTFSDAHKVGDSFAGKVIRIEKYGAFVEIAPGIDGLVHISEMKWSRVEDPSEVTSVGAIVQVKILKIESKDGRLKISLSMKQAEDEPWAKVPKKFPVGTLVSGKVERREPYGIFVTLDEGITGLLPKSKAMEHPEFPFEKIRVGDTVSVEIGEVREKEKRISLTIPRDPDQDEWKNFTSTSSSSGSFGTLGGLFSGKSEQQKSDVKKPKKKK